MSDNCTRSISFNLPGNGLAPDVNVSVTEDGSGSLQFIVTVLSTPSLTGDLRGLFFDLNNPLLLAGLQYTLAPLVTDFDTVDVIDLGGGANMRGNGTQPFDVGLEFGTSGIGGVDDIQLASFTLSSTSGALTLDDIAQVEFGARVASVGAPAGRRADSVKLVAAAPAAPDANDDEYSIFEDGQAGLASPSHTPLGTIFQVLANDTDADGDILTITEVHHVEHGTVTIVDGDDADLLAGDAVLFTPDADYSGPASFEYCITDSNGGTDFANVSVNITAVADVPELSYEVLAGAAVNQVIVRVTSSQTDADSSEFIDRIELAGIPAGVTVSQNGVNPGTEPDQIVQDFVLTLPMFEDTLFDLTVTSVAKETSNGDEQTATIEVPIELQYNLNDLDTTFYAQDQSIWSSGDQFTFTDDRFLGLSESWNVSGGGFLYGASDGYITAGFQSTLEFEGGEIDASLPFDIDVETFYNISTDVLQISSSALLTGGAFDTEGPEGSYMLDFIFELLLNASAGVDFGVDEAAIIDVTIGPYAVDENILDLDSDDLSFEVELPAGFSLNFAWPNVDTSTNTLLGGNTLEASGESNNFFELGLDLDDLVFAILGLPNPFHYEFDVGIAWGSLDLIDFDLAAGLNFLQDFELVLNGLPGIIEFEDGSSQAFSFGSDIVLSNASSYDVDNDGNIDFDLLLDPDADLSNDTDLGINFGYVFDVLKASGGYDILVDSGSISLGPLVHLADTVPITTIGVYDSTFDLQFGEQTLSFAA